MFPLVLKLNGCPGEYFYFFFKAEAVFKEESRLFLKLSDLPEIITLANQVQSLRGNGAICVSLKENIHRIA